jgi:hypothetical protein
MEEKLFHGEFWSRIWSSDVDVSDELSERKINTPLQCAIVDACLDVERSQLDLMAKIEIRLNNSGNLVVKVDSDGLTKTIETDKCPKCGVRIYMDIHPFNSCELVVVEQVMAQ